ncbi:membrane protein [Bacillus sp. FJAT-27916]|nr:membrane protein [Bacillus sp. FJAT-27916]
MEMTETMNTKKEHSYSSRNILSGILFGIGFAAFVDEVVFHQLLRWHHFYDRSTTEIGLISDGLFHAFSWFATIGGLFLLADLRRRHAFIKKIWWGSILLGAGGFQLYDGTIQHKWMKIHQIRYVDNVFVYDLVWNIAAIMMMIAGLAFILSSKRRKAAS